MNYMNGMRLTLFQIMHEFYLMLGTLHENKKNENANSVKRKKNKKVVKTTFI